MRKLRRLLILFFGLLCFSGVIATNLNPGEPPGWPLWLGVGQHYNMFARLDRDRVYVQLFEKNGDGAPALVADGLESSRLPWRHRQAKMFQNLISFADSRGTYLDYLCRTQNPDRLVLTARKIPLRGPREPEDRIVLFKDWNCRGANP